MQLIASVRGDLALDDIDRLFLPFFQTHRKELSLLMKSNGSGGSFTEKVQQVLGGFCMMLPLAPTPLEANLLAGLFVNYLLYVLDHEDTQAAFSTVMTGSLVKITRIVFRLYSDDAGNAFLHLISQYAQR